MFIFCKYKLTEKVNFNRPETSLQLHIVCFCCV